MSHEHKVQEFYDSARHCYERIMGEYWHHGDPDAEAVGLSGQRACEILEERIVALTGLEANGRAFDFGSGIGGPTLHMAKVTGASFVGATNNDRLNQRARERAAGLGLATKVTFETLDDTGYKNLPREKFADGSFDAATFFESVCHLTDREALFREMFRILKPGARLAGVDWIQRPFGENQTEAQIMEFMGPVNEHIRIPNHGTVGSYKQQMEAAGFKVFIARDLFEGVKCQARDEERPSWLNYEGPEADVFRKGDAALHAARAAGVFTVGLWVAGKPA